MTKARPIDWFRIVADLKRKQLTLRDIVGRTGVPKSTILGWTGDMQAEPRHYAGEALILLWAQVMERDRADVPRTREMVGIPTGRRT